MYSFKNTTLLLITITKFNKIEVQHWDTFKNRAQIETIGYLKSISLHGVSGEVEGLCCQQGLQYRNFRYFENLGFFPFDRG